MIVTNGIKIHITKDTTHEEIIKEEPKEEYKAPSLEELKKDEALEVYEDAMSGVLAEMNEALGVGEDR